MDNFKNVGKRMVRMILKSKVFLIVILLILLVAVFLPSFVYLITIEDGTWGDEENGRPSLYGQNVRTPTSTSQDTGLTIDREAIIQDGLTNLNYREEEIANLTDEEIIEELGINKKLKKNPKVTKLDEVTEAELLWCLTDVYSKYLDKPEELEKLLNAEIITQYPKIGQDDDELDGIIEFERHKTDGKNKKLTYIDSETFNNYVSSSDKKALDYFTLDDQGNALVAVLNSTTETITSNDGEMNISEYTQSLDESNKSGDGSYKKVTTTMTTKPINYKNYVQKYTLPFQYLWALLVISDDKDFVLELADLVENSEIVISIYDNITTVEDSDIYKYKKQTRIDKYVRLEVEDSHGVSGYPTERYWLAEDSPQAAEHYNSNYQASYETDDQEYTVTHTIVTETNIPVVDLTKANVWIADYSKEYEYQSGNTTNTEGDSTGLDDTEYIFNEATSKTSNEDSSLLSDGDAVNFAASIKRYIERYANAGTGQSVDVASRSGTNVVRNGLSVNNTVDSDEVVEANVSVAFVKLEKYDRKTERTQEKNMKTTVQKYVAQTPIDNLKDDKNDPNGPNFVSILCAKGHKGAKKLIAEEITGWLFEILETSDDTKNMVDLTKHLLYKATGYKRFNVDFDFEEYGKNSFSSATGGIYGGTIQEKIWFALKNIGCSDIAAARSYGRFSTRIRICM